MKDSSCSRPKKGEQGHENRKNVMEIRTSLSKIADHSRPFANCRRRCRTDWALYWQKMIDDHILGIEKTWYEAAEKDKNAVQFHGVSYVREDRLQEPASKAKEAHIYQVGMAFYFVDQAVSFDGNRTVSDGKLTITNGDKSRAYAAEKLTKQELFQFYQPEIKGMVFLICLYGGLLVFSVFFQYGQHYLLQMSANRIIQKMRQDVFSHIQKMPIRYFDNLPAGKVVARITNDTEAIRDICHSAFNICDKRNLYVRDIHGFVSA